MDKLCMIMHLTTLCTLCIAILLVSHTYIIAIDHVEPGHEEPPEPAPVEGGNYEQDQGKVGEWYVVGQHLQGCIPRLCQLRTDELAPASKY
jgi:hypothetical protein